MKEEEGMKIQDEKFYVLRSKNEKWIYINEGQAVRVLRKLLEENKNLNPADVSLLEVGVMGEEWEIKQVPWSRITMLLVREGK
jgi:hypothetical protein